MNRPTAMRWTGLCAAVVSLSCLFAPAPAAAQAETIEELAEKIMDSERRLRDREDALKKCTAKARRIQLSSHNDQERMKEAEPLKEAVESLIKALGPKARDAKYATFIQSTLKATECWKPWKGLGRSMRPFLKGGSFLVKLAGLRVINEHGASGVGDILLEMLEEASQNPGRNRLEITLVDCATKLPPREGVPIIAKALEVSQYREVRLRAARTLGEFRGKAGIPALMAACVSTSRDEVTACTAAESLVRYGTYDGVAELIKRVEKRKACTFRVYRALCKVSNHEAEGFMGIPPNKWYNVDRAQQREVVAKILEWWNKVKDSTPQNVLMAQLRANGVKNVPNETESKAAVTALIEGLDLEPLSLRYRALDQLNEVAGDALAEWLYDFRSILRMINESVGMREWEPQHGFKEQEKVEQMKREQAQKAALARNWWKVNKDKVERINGQWRLPNN